MEAADFQITRLGPCTVDSPLWRRSDGRRDRFFVDDAPAVRFHLHANRPHADVLLEEAGPRARIFFEPSETVAAIVTCGGLSPGLNNVIRSIVSELLRNYGAKSVLGARRGYLGLTPQAHLPPIELTEDSVSEIDRLGGTILGTSRGPQDPAVMVDFLRRRGVNILFCIGGDGTQRGAFAISQEVARQGTEIAVVGIPKTIDNDVPFVDASFGYATALEVAAEVIRSAHTEARSVAGGVGLVKLMGRNSGFIAAGASVVSQEVDFTLIPEIPFPLHDEGGLLDALERRLRSHDHAVIVVAEGAGRHLMPQLEVARDESGNVLFADIGRFLRTEIEAHFARLGAPLAVKYLDPSYHIRGVPASAYDRVVCDQMARYAVHAGMAGKTGMLIAFRHGSYAHVPIPMVVRERKLLDPTAQLWQAVMQVTGQPMWWPGPAADR